jgi:hypothetical protein
VSSELELETGVRTRGSGGRDPLHDGAVVEEAGRTAGGGPLRRGGGVHGYVIDGIPGRGDP